MTLRKLWTINKYTVSHSQVHNLHAVQITLKSQTLHLVTANAITNMAGLFGIIYTSLEREESSLVECHAMLIGKFPIFTDVSMDASSKRR